MEKIDLTLFEKAVNTLERALQQYQLDEGNIKNEFILDACIQRFEYCYELACKFIERYLKISSNDPNAIKEMSFPDMIRLAHSKGLIKHSWDQWELYRKNRNKTSHGYDEHVAKEIVGGLNLFFHELVFLIDELKRRNENQV